MPISILQDLGESIARVKISNLNGKVTIDGDDHDHLDFVLLDATISRVLWPQDNKYTGNEKPLCRSSDGEMPDAGGIQPGPCSTCPRSQWKGKKDAPECSIVYNLKGYNLEDGRVFTIGVKGSGIKKLRELNQVLELRKSKVQVTKEYRHLGVHIRLASLEETNVEKKKRYFVPDFKVIGLVEDSVLDNLLIYVGAPDNCRIAPTAPPRPVLAMPEPEEAEGDDIPQYRGDTVDLGDGLTGKLVGGNGTKKRGSKKALTAQGAAVQEEIGEEAPF